MPNGIPNRLISLSFEVFVFQRKALRPLLSFAAPKESNKENGRSNVKF
jgi:hypothetical protein